MNRSVFFDAVRAKPFGGSLSAPQVEGTTAILDSCERHGVTDKHHVANILAQVYHETGTYMLPIKETVYASHKEKNPSDATVIARLNSAFAKGQLSWVKTPYWRDGWFGRGPIQITHKRNYEKLGKAIGVDLVGNPSLALDPNIGADTAVVGMSRGLYTGKKLGDYRFPAALDAGWQNHPRRIVNGKDGTDDEIAKFHRQFHAALLAAAGSGRPQDAAPPPPPDIPAPEPPSPAPQRPVDAVLDDLEEQDPVHVPAAPASQPSGWAGLLRIIVKALFGR